MLLGVWAVQLLPQSALPHLSPATGAVQAACFLARERVEQAAFCTEWDRQMGAGGSWCHCFCSLLLPLVPLPSWTF